MACDSFPARSLLLSPLATGLPLRFRLANASSRMTGDSDLPDELAVNRFAGQSAGMLREATSSMRARGARGASRDIMVISMWMGRRPAGRTPRRLREMDSVPPGIGGIVVIAKARRYLVVRPFPRHMVAAPSPGMMRATSPPLPSNTLLSREPTF